ncbi:MAG: TetR/AcrR family transcriptional regulator [Dehalococcoidia bacterium]
MSMTRQERKESITTQRKQQIFDAALKVFSKKGFDQTTIPDIAQEAGVAIGTIYNYYQSKHDLLLSIIKGYISTESFIGLLEQPPESGDTTSLFSLINERLSIGLDNIGIIQLLMTEIQRDPKLRRQYNEQVVAPNFKLMEKYFELRTANNTFRPLNIPIVVRALLGMIIGLSIISKIEGEAGLLRRIPHQELVAEVKKLILKGIQGEERTIKEINQAPRGEKSRKIL